MWFSFSYICDGLKQQEIRVEFTENFSDVRARSLSGKILELHDVAFSEIKTAAENYFKTMNEDSIFDAENAEK